MLFHTTLVGISPSFLRLVSGVRNRLPFNTRCCWSHRVCAPYQTARNRGKTWPKKLPTGTNLHLGPFMWSCENNPTERPKRHLHLARRHAGRRQVLSSNSHGGIFLPWLKDLDCRSPGQMSCKGSISHTRTQVANLPSRNLLVVWHNQKISKASLT